MRSLYSLQCPNCGGLEPRAEGAEPSPKMRKRAEQIASKMHAGEIVSGQVDPEMLTMVAAELREAIISGFGSDFPEIDYDTPDFNMLTALERNVFHFSAAENYQMLKSMSLALRDENGKLRSFKEFRDEALKISGTYLSPNLKTEYNVAVAGAEMAGKWVDIEQNKDSAPLLKYETAGDQRVRPAHRELDGVTRKVDDPFWDLYYPPNGWNCRCDVTQLLNGSETPAHTIKTPDDVPTIFQTNLAKQGLAFPADHPYYDGIPAKILAQGQTLRENSYSKVTRTKAMKADVHVSTLADPGDLKQNLQYAKQLAENGVEVKIRPHSDAPGVKNPEIQIGSQTGDFKVDPKKTSLEGFVRNSIKNTNKQGASIPIIVMEGQRYNKDEVWKALRGELKDTKRKKSITSVWLLVESKLTKITRSQIHKGLRSQLP